MNAKILPFPRGPQRIVLEQIGVLPEAWLVACSCGAQSRHDTREDARAARRRHQAAHDRARAAHPAGKRRPTGGGAA